MLSLQRKHFAFYILSPFLLFLFSLKDYRSKFFPGILYLFCLFYGFTFTVASDAFDGARIIQKFAEASEASFFQYTRISEILSTGDTQIVEDIIIWFVANTFESSQVLFLIYAAIFGYFYIKNFQIIVSLFGFKNTFFEYVLLISFMMLIPIWEINGWRMWTASHIFVYAVFNLVTKRVSVKYLLLMFMTPFVHFSFWMMILPVVVFLLLKRVLSRKILLPLFILTLFINPFNVEKSALENTVSLEFAQSKIKGYGNEEYIEGTLEKEQQLVFHARYYKTALHFGLIIPFVFLLVKTSKFDEKFKSILYWTLFFGIVVNVIALFPFADMLRFRMIHYFFVIFSLVYILKSYSYSFGSSIIFRFFSLGIISLLIFFNLVEFRKGLDRFGITTILTNPITVHFYPAEENVAIINLIK